MKYEKTKHEGIFKYYLKSGTVRYRVRVTYLDRFNEQQEISKQGFKSLSDAKVYKSKIETQMNDGSFHEHKDRSITLGDYWKDFADAKVRLGDWNKSTEQTNRGRMNVWLNRFEHVELDKITRNDVQNYIDELYEENEYSEATVKGFMRIFRQVINDAVEEEYLVRNKFKKVSTKHPDKSWKPKNKKIPNHIYDEFLQLAEEHMRKDIFTCFYLLTFGLRRGEAYGIRLKDITFLDNGLTQINIERSRTRDYPEGKDVKSRDSFRVIVVDEKATTLLSQQIKHARYIKAKLNQTLHVDDYIFIGPLEGEPFYIECLNDAIDEITALMDPKLKLHPHMFRHTFATRANAAGVDALQLIRYMGHAGLDMTMHYTGSTVENAQNVLRLIQAHNA